MSEYHKINTVWKRQSEKPCDMIVGAYSQPEFAALAEIEWLWEEKVDGTNIRVTWHPGPGTLTYRGKTDRAQTPDFLREGLERWLPREKMAEVFPDTPVILYGEGFGAKIQKGGGNYISGGNDFCLFDVLIGYLWLERPNVRDVALKLKVPVAPEVGRGTLLSANDFVAAGFNSQWGDFEAEGVVLRPEVELFDRRGHRIITKLKTKDFRALERHG